MKYIVCGLGLLSLTIPVMGILDFFRRPSKAKKGNVFLPNFILIIGLSVAVLFLIFTLIAAFSDEAAWTSILFFAFSLLGSALIMAYVNCKIFYNEDFFIVRNFWGLKRKLTYDQVTAIRENLHENYIYIGKRKAMIDEYAIGGTDFIAFVHKKYKKLHSGQELPRILHKNDLFNGHVMDAGGMLFVYVLVSLIILLLSVLIGYSVFAPNTINNTTKRQLIFESCISDGENIMLASPDNQIYKIQYIDERFDIKTIETICDGKTEVTVYSQEVVPDKGECYYSIKAIQYDDTYLLSFDETNRLHRQENWPMIFIPLLMILLWGAFIAGSIIVGRNPQKFNKKIVHLFFKKGSIWY